MGIGVLGFGNCKLQIVETWENAKTVDTGENV